MKIKKLVTGVGPLREADAVLPAAAALAGRAGLPLEVVHAFDVSDPFVDTYLRATTVPGDPLRHYAEGLQARMEGQIGGLAGCGDVHCRAQPGAAPAILHDATCGGDCLLVVGPHAPRQGRRGAPGHHRRSACSTAPPPPCWCCTASFPPPRASLLRGPGLARRGQDGGGGPRRCSARSAPTRRRRASSWWWGWRWTSPSRASTTASPAHARERLDAFVAELPAGTRVEPRIRTGSPAREAVAEAAEWPADVVVVGSHGRTGAARALLGSVAEAVVRDAHCSVLVIPPGAAG
jgi:nucleotide-binding universal stress UspA family protein